MNINKTTCPNCGSDRYRIIFTDDAMTVVDFYDCLMCRTYWDIDGKIFYTLPRKEICATCGLPREYCVCEYPFLEYDREGNRLSRRQGEAFKSLE